MTDPHTLPPRTGPRPLPLHMALEGWILQSSFAGLMPSSVASMPWSPSPAAQGRTPNPALDVSDPARLIAALAANQKPDSLAGPWHAYLDPVRFLDAVTQQAGARMTSFVAGVRAYHAHPFRRAFALPPTVWESGAARLLSAGGDGAPVLYVPSLVNRAYILDLAADRSLLRATAAQGLNAFLLDWGEPSDRERAFTLTDYIERVLIPAMEDVVARTGQRLRLVGYCMGGTLAVAAAVLRPDLVEALALLAAPWDFHVDNAPARTFMAAMQVPLTIMIEAEGVASVDLLQAMFASLDPTLAGRKFRRFATLDPQSDEALRFVELEDWLNDGVPLAGAVMKEVLVDWYGANSPARAVWKIADTAVDPTRIACPTLVMIPAQDRIVPPESAAALARVIPGAVAHNLPLGHIGMIAGGSAPRRVYDPLISWLRAPTMKA